MKMNKIIYIMSFFAGMLLLTTACENEDLNPYVEPLPGVHAFAQLAEGSAADFSYGDVNESITHNIRWISIDNQLAVNRIDLFILFNEDYTDEDDNPLVASHGGSEGILFRTIEGSEIPGNREDITFSLSQSEIYALYQNATFDYDEDGTATPVFANPEKPDRQGATAPFIADDNFVVRWVLYTENDLVVDSWSPSVCTELPGANCQVIWGVEAVE